MVVLFWVSCAVVAYVYAGYPVLLAVWARLRPRAVARRPDTDATGPERPAISIVIAARNEGPRLPARIDNLLQLEYPADRRQIIVVSDGSTDDTLARLARYGPAVETVAVPVGGKALALNAGVERARFDLLVFADARQTFAPDALAELAKPFQDPQVGAVTGELLLDSESAGRRTTTGDRRVRTHPGCGGGGVERRAAADRRRAIRSTVADGVGLYWRYEKQLRRLESTVWSTLGATGAIYAMRRSLWKPLPADTLLDDVLAPMRCVLAGYRVVFNDRAQAFDRTPPDADTERRRKIRTLAGNYQILRLEPQLLLPWRNRVWIQYLSHKIARLLVPYALLAFMASSIALAGRAPVYAAALGAQLLFYLFAGYGAWLDRRDATDVHPETPGFAPGWPGARPRADRGAVNA
jgi:cellulose synthase/poly-beta-1,6-N-acetylglucosamine synthase-like glycosyltransferase